MTSTLERRAQTALANVAPVAAAAGLTVTPAPAPQTHQTHTFRQTTKGNRLVLLTGEKKSTADLVQSVKSELEALSDLSANRVDHWLSLGVLLNTAKYENGIKHGQWQDWLDSNFKMSRTSARDYMRIANNWAILESRIEEYTGTDLADLSLKEILRLIPKTSTPRPPRKPWEEEKLLEWMSEVAKTAGIFKKGTTGPQVIEFLKLTLGYKLPPKLPM